MTQAHGLRLASIPQWQVAYVFNAVKKIFLWNYARNSWQWDILCVLILIFIFLTPKDWFQTSERWRIGTHQTSMSTLLVGPEVIDNEEDNLQLEQRLRAVTHRPEAKVMAVRKVLDEQGTVCGYEIDIR